MCREPSQYNRWGHPGRNCSVRRGEDSELNPLRGWIEEEVLADHWERLHSEIGRQSGQCCTQNPKEDGVLKGRVESALPTLQVRWVLKDYHKWEDYWMCVVILFCHLPYSLVSEIIKTSFTFPNSDANCMVDIWYGSKFSS